MNKQDKNELMIAIVAIIVLYAIPTALIISKG